VPGADLSCRELVELISDYLDNELPPGERARFDSHLAACPGCETYLSQVDLTKRELGRLTEDDLDPAAERALLWALRSWNSPA
jgi:anti-sigma factor RsiW